MKPRGHCLSRISAAALMVWPVATLAQVAPPAEAGAPSGTRTNDGIQDIIVTAERRSQSTQRSPLTIQAFDGEAATKAGLASAVDIGKMTTGVEIGAAGSNTQIYVRGVGSFAFTPLESPGVAFNVDGAYVGRPAAVNGAFFDIARLEVLKGPQGTLYGRNANGGSINLITNGPELGRTSLDLNVETGNYDMAHATAAINLPLGDTVAIRAAGNVMHRNGYLSDGTFDDKQEAGRVRVKWVPSADVSLLLNADYVHIGGKGSNGVFLPRRPGSDAYESLTETASQDYKHSFPNAPLAAFTNTDRKDAYQDNEFYNFSAQLDWNLGFADLTVMPAYRHSKNVFLTYDLGAQQFADSLAKQKTLEVRLGRSSPALTWVVGGFYFNEKQDGFLNVTAGDVPVPFLGNTVLLSQRVTYDASNKSYAGFGQATLRLFEGFRLIAGGRYTHEKVKLDGAIINLLPLRQLTTFPGTASFNGTTFKAGAEYDLGPRSLLYATFSNGFKAGGLNQTPTPALQRFRPEKLQSYEVGSKNRFFDNRLQVNVSGFYWKYKNLQDSRAAFDAFAVNFITFNSGNATIYGGTLDLVVKPTNQDTFSFSGEYAHSEYDSFLVNTPTPLFQNGSTGCPTSSTGPFGVTTANCKGFQVARVPKWTATASYEHAFPIAGGASLVAGASVKYGSSRWIGIDFIPAERDGAYALVDANLTYNAPGDRWNIGVFGRNITKTVYYTGGVTTSFIPGLFAANIGAPQTYGVRAGFHF